MIDKNDRIQKMNIDLLIEGYWYEDLPPILDIENMKNSIKEVIENIDKDAYEDFYKVDGLITEYKNTESPTYIFNDGIEPVTFFEFKKNGALREMQIPNLKYYCTFVYNTIAVYDKLLANYIINRSLINMFAIQTLIYYLMSYLMCINYMTEVKKLLNMAYLL